MPAFSNTEEFIVSARTTRSVSMLIVEDNDALRLTLELVFQEQGYHVLTASGMDEAIALVDAYGLETFGLIILDVYLGGQRDVPEGYLLYERWVADDPALPCLLISGSPDASALPAVEAGVLPLLAKPFTIDALLAQSRMLDVREKAH